MFPDNIVKNQWWRPAYMYDPQNLSPDMLARNTSGTLYNGGNIVASAILSTQFGVRPEWNIDFEQARWGESSKFHNEKIEIIGAKKTGRLLFIPNSYWHWSPSTDYTCKNVVLSLRIGGCLVELWHLQETKIDISILSDHRTCYSLKFKAQTPHRYVPPARVVEATTKEIEFGLETRPSQHPTSIFGQFTTPPGCNVRFYDQDPRLLLLDWFRYRGTISASKKVENISKTWSWD